jgi:hypothetical protein
VLSQVAFEQLQLIERKLGEPPRHQSLDRNIDRYGW